MMPAKSKGFYRATDFKTATDAGFSNNEEYNKDLFFVNFFL